MRMTSADFFVFNLDNPLRWTKMYRKSKKITFVTNNISFFFSHRIAFAEAAAAEGFTVDLLSGHSGSDSTDKKLAEKLNTLGFSSKKLEFYPSSMNPLREFVSLGQIVIHFILHRPNIAYCSTPKAVLYGGIAARLSLTHSKILSITGMGFLFTDRAERNEFKYLVIKRVYLILLKFALRGKNVWLIVENRDDFNYFANGGFNLGSNLVLIPSSGVNLRPYQDIAIIKKEKIVLFPARMLKDKGLVDFIGAIRIIKLKRPDIGWRFILAGSAEQKNPSSVTSDEIRSWEDEGLVDWLGHVDEIAPLFLKSAIVCLPSYREGFPKALLEAGAAGCAIVTTDVIGCRDAIIPNITGTLVPVRDSNSLADALIDLIDNSNKRVVYGLNGKKHVAENFSIERISDLTIDIFKKSMFSPLRDTHE